MPQSTIPLQLKTWRRFLGTLLALAALAPAPSYAQQIGPAEPSSRQALYRSAHEAIRLKNWELARKLLSDLWTSAKTHDVAISLAQVEYHLGNDADAARYTAWAVALVPPQEKAETVEQYKGALAEIKQKVATVRVHANQTIAHVRVDGKPAAESPERELYLSPGVHVIEGWADNRVVGRQSIDVEAGQEREIQLENSSEPRHTSTRLENAGASQRRPPDSRNQSMPADADGGKPDWPYWVSGAVAVVGLGFGIAFTIAADAEADDAESLQRDLRAQGWTNPCSGPQFPGKCGELGDTLDARDRDRDIAAIGFAAAGAGVLALGAYWLLPESMFRNATVTIGPRHGAILLGSRF